MNNMKLGNPFKLLFERYIRIGNYTIHSMTPKQKKSKQPLVVIFLAILHLAREQLINLEQNGHFSDIMIEHREAGK